MKTDKQITTLITAAGWCGILSIVFAWLSDEAFKHHYIVGGMVLCIWTLLWISLTIWCFIGAIQSE